MRVVMNFHTTWLGLGFVPATMLYFVAGFLGGLARAFATKGQAFLSPQTLTDVIISGVTGVLFVASGLVPDAWTPAYAAAAIVMVTYVSSDLGANLIKRFNLLSPPTDRRAEDPPKESSHDSHP